jgi:hypothetical protein
VDRLSRLTTGDWDRLKGELTARRTRTTTIGAVASLKASRR